MTTVAKGLKALWLENTYWKMEYDMLKITAAYFANLQK